MVITFYDLHDHTVVMQRVSATTLGISKSSLHILAPVSEREKLLSLEGSFTLHDTICVPLSSVGELFIKE